MQAKLWWLREEVTIINPTIRPSSERKKTVLQPTSVLVPHGFTPAFMPVFRSCIYLHQNQTLNINCPYTSHVLFFQRGLCSPDGGATDSMATVRLNKEQRAQLAV